MPDELVPLDHGDNPLEEKRKNEDLPSEAALISEAREALVDGEKSRAIELLNQVLSINPNSVDALWLSASTLAEMNKSKALQALTRLTMLQPNHPKASALLKRLEDELDSSAAAARAMSHQPVAPQQPQIIIQNVQNQATQVAASGVGRNDAAFIIGLIIGIIPGFFGVAHIINGKVGTGILLILSSFVWGAIALSIITFSAGIGSCLVLPLHLYIAYSTAKSGASNV